MFTIWSIKRDIIVQMQSWGMKEEHLKKHPRKRDLMLSNFKLCWRFMCFSIAFNNNIISLGWWLKSVSSLARTKTKLWGAEERALALHQFVGSGWSKSCENQMLLQVDQCVSLFNSWTGSGIIYRFSLFVAVSLLALWAQQSGIIMEQI